MTENRPQLADQEFRDQIASDLDCTMLVEAAAGTGKTTCLVARMIGLLRAGKCRVESLAAVTFTRKAAAELRSRFQLRLEDAAKQDSDDEQDRLQNALKSVDRCFIGTIHSLCARLLRERPVEAQLPPDFSELDETLDTKLRQQAWREHVAKLVTTNDPILPELESLGLKVSDSTSRSFSAITELDELGLEPAELGPAFMTYAEYPDIAEWPAQQTPLPDLAPYRDALDHYVEHIKSLSLPSDFGRDKLIPKYERICRMVRTLDLTKPAELMEVFEEFQSYEKTPLVQKKWPGKKPQAIAEWERWNEFCGQYAEPLLEAWRAHRYEPSLRAIQPAKLVYDKLRRERNGLNFGDLLLRTASLLRGKPEVRRYFRSRFTHLLVDEFQDTDPIQAEVMLLLTSDDDREENWQACRPLPGSLFVVGDPKQSIYRFRRADILTYNKVREIIEKAGGAVVPLTTNFRSVEPILNWVNGFSETVFPDQADDFSPTNRPLRTGRDDTLSEPAVACIRVPETVRKNQDVAEHEAALVARSIRRMIDEGSSLPRTDGELKHGRPVSVEPGDFMIVTRGKDRLSVYASELQQYGIPNAVTGGSSLNEVLELELLTLCLTAVSRSDDPISLVAVLRSELFGVADTSLYELRRLGGRFSYNSELPEGMSDEDIEVFQDAFQRLRTYSRWLRRMPAAAAIESIAADLGLIAHACATEQGSANAGGLLKAIELLRSADGQHTAGDSVDLFKRLVDRSEKHDSIPVRPPAEMPVRVMNLHQCKGLEAPIVFLVDPSGDREHDVEVYIDRRSEQPRGYLPIYGPKPGEHSKPKLLAHPPGWSELAAQEQRFLDAEKNRLLYVAATRAGVKLVVSQRPEKSNGKNPWQPFDVHLQGVSDFVDPGGIASKPKVNLVVSSDEWNRERDEREERWDAILKPSYAVEAIKESAITGEAKPHGSDKGGARWGQVIHTLLETKMKEPEADLLSLAVSALESEELPIELAENAVDTTQQVLDSQIWKRARAAQQCLAEVPLVLPADDSLPTIRRGVIDLIFREASGWVLVDYKTERVPEADIPALVSYYKPQVSAYVDAWEAVVGELVVEAGLFFTHSGRFVAVEGVPIV